MADEQFEIRRAVRSQALARMALCGASGGGKTTGSLLLARGMVEYLVEAGLVQGSLEGKIGVIDTERRSAALYAHLVPFDAIELSAPYTPARYIGAMRALERAGCRVIIMDQISHAWAGAGGILETVDLLRSRSSNQFEAWKDATPEQNQFVEDLLGSSAHLICTMRAKTQYVMEEYTKRDGTRGSKPKKVGMAPVQRAGIEYEFTTMLDLDNDGNVARASKDRTGLFWGKETRLSVEWGRKLMHWLMEGEAIERAASREPSPEEAAEAVAGSGQRALLRCRNLPDLQRTFEDSIGRLREYKGKVDGQKLRYWSDSLIDVKDRLKDGFDRARTGAVVTEAVVSADVVVGLSDFAKACRVEVPWLLERLGVGSLQLVPVARLTEACQAIADRAVEEGDDPVKVRAWLPATLASAGVALKEPAVAGAPAARKGGAFDDMKDDIPF